MCYVVKWQNKLYTARFLKNNLVINITHDRLKHSLYSLKPYALKNHQSDVQIAFIQSHKSLIIVLRFIFASVRFNPSWPFWIWSPISSDLIAVELFFFYAVKKAEKDLWALHKWWSFPLRISLVNVTKSAGKCGIGHMY